MENNELLQAIGIMISENNRKMIKDMSSIMDDKLEPINNRLDNLEKGQNALEQGQATLQRDMTEVKQRTTKIEIVLEHDISKKMDALFDGHQLDSEKLSKLDAIEKTAKETKDTVDVMFKVVQGHSGKIKEIKLLK